MKKSICEKIFAAVLAVTLPAEFVGVMGMESNAGAWATWLGIGCAVLQLTTMAMVKVVWKREEDNPSTACRRSPSLYTREARADVGIGPYGCDANLCGEVRE